LATRFYGIRLNRRLTFNYGWDILLTLNRQVVGSIPTASTIKSIYLWKAHRDGLLQESSLPEEFNDLILKQLPRKWHIYITPQMSKKHFLGYAGRYIRRPPIAQNRIVQVSDEEVVYWSKDAKSGAVVKIHCNPAKFVALLRPNCNAPGSKTQPLGVW
jgi:hypothetical protein